MVTSFIKIIDTGLVLLKIMENMHIVVLNQSIKLQTHGEYYQPAKITDNTIAGYKVK